MDRDYLNSNLEKFNSFLAKINLEKYRSKYSKIKLVELDLPRNIQAIRLLYQCYWHNVNLLDYDDFYSLYITSLQNELEEFRKNQMFSKETFYRGIPARIYRTWASLLTQIQGGYAANSIYPKIDMSADLDYSGIDMRIYTDFINLKNNKYINIQIKKETVSREVRAPWVGLKGGEQITNITYEVTRYSPLTPTGKICIPYQRWKERWSEKLKKLDNGFVIFLPEMFNLNNIKIP